MKFLNRESTEALWNGVKSALVQKQDELRGTIHQIVGFNEEGRPVARATASPGGIATLDKEGVLEAAQRPGLAGIRGGSNPNLLDNCDFTIWERCPGGDFTGVPINIFLADRYQILSANGNIKNSIKQIAGGGIYNESGPNCRVKYFMEGASKLNGKTVTLSVFEKNEGVPLLRTATFFAEKLGETTDLFNKIPNLIVWLRTGSSILRAKLELGEEQTLARQNESGEWELIDPPPERASELLKCQRYQVVYGGEGGMPLLAPGYSTGTVTAVFLLDLPTPMRATPAVRFSNLYVNLSGTRIPVTGAAVLGTAAQNKLAIQVTCSGAGFLANQPCFLEGQGEYRLLLDANL